MRGSGKETTEMEWIQELTKIALLLTFSIPPPPRYMPEELLERFQDICTYLKGVLPKILRVHPKLEHNPGLVQRMEKFNESYNRVCNWVSSR